MRKLASVTALLAAGSFGFVTFAPAAPFDFIYTDQVDVTLCQGCGITLAELGFALLVNTGDKPLLDADLNSIQFSATSSEPGISLTPFFNQPGPALAPVAVDEAIGSILPDNAVLLGLLAPGETHRNTPYQVFAFQIERAPDNTYVGPVSFEIRMTMSGDEAHFVITADLSLGSHAISFPSAARVSSSQVPTPTQTVTWGRIKAQYR